MQLIDLFKNFEFHDAWIDTLSINGNNIEIQFALCLYMQSKETIEIYKIENDPKKYLSLRVKFNDCTITNELTVSDIAAIDLDIYDTLDIIYCEKTNDITIIYFRDFETDETIDISFSCKDVEILHCHSEK